MHQWCPAVVVPSVDVRALVDGGLYSLWCSSLCQLEEVCRLRIHRSRQEDLKNYGDDHSPSHIVLSKALYQGRKRHARGKLLPRYQLPRLRLDFAAVSQECVQWTFFLGIEVIVQGLR